MGKGKYVAGKIVGFFIRTLLFAAALFAAAAVYENPYLLIGAFYAVICLIKY